MSIQVKDSFTVSSNSDFGDELSVINKNGKPVLSYTGVKKARVLDSFTNSSNLTFNKGKCNYILNSDISVNSIDISGSPTKDTHAATVGYVKNFVQGMDVKESVKCATIEHIDDLSVGSIQVDNITVQIGDRVLVKNQNIESQNGIYLADASGWSRAQDFDEPDEVQGAFVFVEQGTTNAAKGFIQLSNAPVLIGEDPIKFTQFNGTYAFNSGDGLTQDGNTLNVDASLNHVTNMTGLIVIGSSDLTTSVYSNLTVASNKVTHLGGSLDVCGNMVVDGTSNLMSDVTVAHDKSTYLGGTLTVADGKETHLGGRLDVCGNMVVDGTSNLMSDVTVASNKITHLGGRLDVCGNMVVDGTSNLMSDVTVANGKATHLGGRLDVCGNMVVDGTSNLMSDITVANGKATHLGGRLDVCGNMVVDGTSNLMSDVTVANGKVTHLGGRLDVCGNMVVDGTSNLMSDVTVASNKITHLGGRLDVCGNMVVDGTSNLMSDVTVANGKVTHLGGRLDVCGNMVVDGTSNLMSDVTVANGKATHLGGRLDVCGNMVVDGTLDISSSLIGLNVNNQGTDAGLLVMRKDASNVLIGWDENEEKFVLGLTNAINSATSEVGIITKGVLLADLSGNAETAKNATNSDAVTVDISGELQVTSGQNTINMNRGSYSSKFIIDPSGNLIINIGNQYFRYNLTSASNSYNGV